MSQNKATSQISFKNVATFAAKFVVLWIVGLILKKFFQTNDIYSNSLEFCRHILLMSLGDARLSHLGYFWINLETFILKIIVPLWILKFATNLTNFSFSGNQLSTFPWWYATVIMLFIFMRRTSSYSLLMLAASLVLSNSSALLFRSSILLLSLLTSESINCCLTSSSLSRFLFLTFLEPFHH